MSPTSPAPASAVVFAYHDVGVRCLKVLLDAGVRIPLVVTHADSPGEAIWFGSVAALAAEHGLHCVTPADPHTPELLALAAQERPDFLFSFYYRQMLRRDWLDVPARGAFNMHGSLLPKYRGRAPVNWAILHGERETGATLHRMTEKPDNGDIVDQCAVPILGEDTAHEVFCKVTLAAEIVMARSLPRLIDGSARPRRQDLSQGRYFGGRRAQDGLVPAQASARQAHDLVRAVAPPHYPGAFVHVQGRRLVLERTRLAEPALRSSAAPTPGQQLASDGECVWLTCADGSRLRVLAAHFDGEAPGSFDARALEAQAPTRMIAVDLPPSNSN